MLAVHNNLLIDPEDIFNVLALKLRKLHFFKKVDPPHDTVLIPLQIS